MKTEEVKTEQALAAGLISIDAARRVGWAKAFDAARRVDGLEQEVAQLQSELNQLRRTYSRLLGFAYHIPEERSEVLENEFQKHIAAEQTFRDSSAWAEGVAVAERHRAGSISQQERRDARKDARKSPRRQLLRQIVVDAAARGHGVDLGLPLEDGVERLVCCSCGESIKTTSEKVVHEWMYNHLTLSAYGVDFDSYKRGRVA